MRVVEEQRTYASPHEMLLQFLATSYSGKYCLQMVQSQRGCTQLHYYQDGFITAEKSFCYLVSPLPSPRFTLPTDVWNGSAQNPVNGKM